MLKFYLGVFLGLSQVSGECNYRFVCNTGLVHPAGSILDKIRENGGRAGGGQGCFYCSTLPAHSCENIVKQTGPQSRCDPGLVPLTEQGRVMALGAEPVFFHLKEKGRTKLSFTFVWIGLFCPCGNFVDAHVLPACWVPMGDRVLCMLKPLCATI